MWKLIWNVRTNPKKNIKCLLFFFFFFCGCRTDIGEIYLRLTTIISTQNRIISNKILIAHFELRIFRLFCVKSKLRLTMHTYFKMPSCQWRGHGNTWREENVVAQHFQKFTYSWLGMHPDIVLEIGVKRFCRFGERIPQAYYICDHALIGIVQMLNTTKIWIEKVYVYFPVEICAYCCGIVASHYGHKAIMHVQRAEFHALGHFVDTEFNLSHNGLPIALIHAVGDTARSLTRRKPWRMLILINS